MMRVAGICSGKMTERSATALGSSNEIHGASAQTARPPVNVFGGKALLGGSTMAWFTKFARLFVVMMMVSLPGALLGCGSSSVMGIDAGEGGEGGNHEGG